MVIDYSAFIAICRVEKPKNFGGFNVKTDGLYTIVPDDDAPLSPTERAVLSWHPTGIHNTPALPLPCTLEELRVFVANAGLLGCIDEEVVTAMQSDAGDAATRAGVVQSFKTLSAADRPLLQQLFQEQEILRVIRELSHEPKKLPKREYGKPGIKANVRQALTFSPKVFDKAWERLRANRDIQDAE